MMDEKQLVADLREYAENISMRVSCGCVKTVLEAADTIEELSAENKQLRTDLTLQTALAQNGKSAIETNQQLTKKLQAAMRDIKELASRLGDICDYCKHYRPCEEKECKDYIEGIGAEDEKGNYVDWKWTCRDFNYGECPRLENTVCNGCFENDDSGFEWREIYE